MIKDHIVCGIISEHVKERLLRETNLTLEKAIGISQVDEESKKQAKILNDETTTTESIMSMAIMKDKEEQNNQKRHRSEDTVRGSFLTTSTHLCLLLKFFKFYKSVLSLFIQT